MHFTLLRMNGQYAARRLLFQAGNGAPESGKMRTMLPETNNEEICPVRVKKGNEAINFSGLDQVACYVDGVSAALGNGELHQFLVKSRERYVNRRSD